MKQKFVAQETGNKPMWRWDVLSRSERQEALRKHDKIAQETGFGAKLSGDYRKEFAAFMWLQRRSTRKNVHALIAMNKMMGGAIIGFIPDLSLSKQSANSGPARCPEGLQVHL